MPFWESHRSTRIRRRKTSLLHRVLNDYRASNCAEAMEAKVMNVARDMLTPEQYEKFEAEWNESRLQIAR